MQLITYSFISVILLFSIISCSGNSEVVYYGTLLNNHDSYKFNLKDHLGRDINSSNLNSDVAILTFMFTQCTDVCPILTNNIKKSLAKIPESDKIPVIVISVDPANDSDEKMNEFYWIFY